MFIFQYLLRQKCGLIENLQKDQHVKKYLINLKLTLLFISLFSPPFYYSSHPFFWSSIHPSIHPGSWNSGHTILLAHSSWATVACLLSTQALLALALGSSQELCSLCLGCSSSCFCPSGATAVSLPGEAFPEIGSLRSHVATLSPTLI